MIKPEDWYSGHCGSE